MRRLIPEHVKQPPNLEERHVGEGGEWPGILPSHPAHPQDAPRQGHSVSKEGRNFRANSSGEHAIKSRRFPCRSLSRAAVETDEPNLARATTVG